MIKILRFTMIEIMYLLQILLRMYNLCRRQQAIQEMADGCRKTHQFRTL